MKVRKTMSKFDQSGVAHFGLIIVIILVLVGVGFVFWRVQDQASDNSEPATTAEIQTDDTIEDEADLADVEEGLNQADIDADLDVSELDAVIE